MDLWFIIKEVNAIFVHFIIDKPKTEPTYYIKIDRQILKKNLVVKSLGIIILFAKDPPQPWKYTRVCCNVSIKRIEICGDYI